MDFVQMSNMEKDTEYAQNDEFYSNCAEYFESLRHKGKLDYEFEDEFYFTMPAISSK